MVTVLTERLGKISIVARGVRKITSRRAGNIELLNRVKLHLFKGKGYTLTEAESLETFPRIKENLILSTTAFHVIELVDRLVPEEQKNYQVFDLTLAVLRILERNPRQIIIRAFEVKILSLLGFWGTEGFGDLNEELWGILKKLQYFGWHNIEKLEISKEQSLALERVMRYYIEKILESKLKSVEVLRKLMA